MKVRKEVKEAMKVLGIDQCRRGQLKPIGKILKGKDVLLIAPTGFGKSMVYQIPAVCWADRLTLVVEPLVALMHDQVKSLQSRGIRAAYLDSTQSAKEQEKVLHKVRQGSCSVLFVTPERLESHVFQKTVRKVDIALLVVDECHCVLRWGASFRPAYQKIGALGVGGDCTSGQGAGESGPQCAVCAAEGQLPGVPPPRGCMVGRGSGSVCAEGNAGAPGGLHAKPLLFGCGAGPGLSPDFEKEPGAASLSGRGVPGGRGKDQGCPGG